MRLTLNLATRPFADLGPAIKRLRIGMAVLAFLSILLGIGLHAIHQKAEAARTKAHSLDGQISRIAQEEAGYQALMRQPDNAQLLQQAAVLNKIIDDKSFSWTLAMEDLETVLPGGVQVTSLDPQRQKDGHIVLHLRVVGPRDHNVDLLRNLEHSRRFLLPRITGENSADSNNSPGQRLQPVSAADRMEFDVLADYNPATSEERKSASRKAAAAKSEEDKSMRAPRPLHPLPLPKPGLGRTPYTGSPNPANRGPLSPAARFPTRGPNAAPNSKPNPGLPGSDHSGGPQ
jgi:type IV pilus assembly protein PilN